MKQFMMKDETHAKLKAMSEMTGHSMSKIVTFMVDNFGGSKLLGMSAPTSVRDVAVEGGFKVYAGSPCKWGHDGRRYSSSGVCVECVKISRKMRKVKGETTEVRDDRFVKVTDRIAVYVSNVPCEGCKGVERYVGSGRCKSCFSGDGERIKGVSHRDNRTYEGHPCSNSEHGSIRFLDTGDCVSCKPRN